MVREERLEALMQVRGHALQQQNCWPLWADEQVRRAVLDAIQAPDPERGKSLYTEEGPPPNHPSVRTAACGVLVQLAMDEAVREEMAQDTLVRESLVEALQVEAEEAEEAKEAEETPEGDGKEEEKEEVGTPFFVQSRAQQLLAMLVPARACAKALQRPQAALGLSRLYEGAEVAEAEEDFEWVEEGEEEEEFEDDPLVETEATTELPAHSPGSEPEKDRGEKAKAARSGSDSDSEVDPDSLLAEVEDILNAKKPSSDEDLLQALVAMAAVDNEEELRQLPPWRLGAARSRRLDALWTFAAAAARAEASLWRPEVRDALVNGAQASQPDAVRVSSLGVLSALAAREENRQAMWRDPQVRQVFVLAAADQTSPGSGEDVRHLRPQKTELRLQALLGLWAFAENEELRQEIWSDSRIVASLRTAAEQPPLRKMALAVLQRLPCAENQAAMVAEGIPKIFGAALTTEELDRRCRRGCELARDRLLAA
ncbi:unnamed protein product [Effrenium voratum]|uniref:Uncharacterized protein n=1 Tax=Effrenium voratum TaxID=2562239 RepID=A0AA36IAY3_9DINO|nr:unnamed protein product [Effrenium voratum]CAJ1459742.1 unnamed protein product [Effrenium voratum]